MIEFNGKIYASVEEMPPEERKVYEEAMRLLAEGKEKGLGGLMKEVKEVSGSHQEVEIRAVKIVVNGQEYTSVEGMPPEARKIYEQSIAEMERLAGRSADGQALEAGTPSATEPVVSAPSLGAAPPQSTSRVVTEEPTLRFISILVVLFLTVAVGFVLMMFLLR